MHWTEKHIKTSRGPLGVVRFCTVKKCKFYAMVKTGIHGVGRGYGMREGNKARGKMIQHVKSEHPELKPTEE